VLIAMALTSSFAYSEDMKLRLVYSDIESFPIQIGNGMDIADPPGIAVELIKRAAEALGLKVEFVRRPNKRVLIELQKGIADGAFCFSFTEERLQYGRYPMRNGQLDNSRRVTVISYYL
jgi:polar amino acid transport system substrate-binding protein